MKPLSHWQRIRIQQLEDFLLAVICLAAETFVLLGTLNLLAMACNFPMSELTKTNGPDITHYMLTMFLTSFYVFLVTLF